MMSGSKCLPLVTSMNLYTNAQKQLTKHRAMAMHTASLQKGTISDDATVRLCGTDLQSIPRNIYEFANTLKTLDLSNNRLCELPDDFHRLTNLQILFASNNPFRVMPEVLGKCENLQMIGLRNCKLQEVSGHALPQKLNWLILTDNSLTKLPRELGERPFLQKLMLSCNKLDSLPSLAACERLELMRIASNAFAEFPEEVLNIPNLAWLAVAGNPFTLTDEKINGCSIDFQKINLQECIGEGASGHVWEATMGKERKPFAVKVFKSGSTSDGTPQSELAAGLAAGSHPNLLTPIGSVSNYPEGKLAMALPLLPSEFKSLASPPSLQSCTRDVYNDDFCVSTMIASQLVNNIETAIAHLHARNIIHGDLYAHNVLWDPKTGEAILSDFGAAVIATSLAEKQTLALKAIELRALEILKREIFDRVRNGTTLPESPIK